MENKFYTGLYIMVPFTVEKDESISNGAFRLYCRIATYANNPKGYCYKNHSSLIKEMKISTAQFYRYIDELVKSGHIYRKKINNRIYLAPTVNIAIINKEYVENFLQLGKNENKIEIMDYDWLNEEF